MLSVLVVAYRRPEKLRRVLNRLAVSQEHELEIHVDAPRNSADKAAVDRVLGISQEHLEAHGGTLHPSKNHKGAKISVYSAVSDFLSRHGEGVILEDDTLPGFDFLPFASEMLQRFRSDHRIGMVSGNNHVGDDVFPFSYGFSRNKSTWGWATWQRAWEGFHPDFIKSKHFSLESALAGMTLSANDSASNHWSQALRRIHAGKVDAWDWQWFMYLGLQSQLAVTPSRNLVANIGFGDGATHTTGAGRSEYFVVEPISWPLVHPQNVSITPAFERGHEARKYFYSQQQTSRGPSKEGPNSELPVGQYEPLFTSRVMTRLQRIIPKSNFRRSLRNFIRYRLKR